jgi:hypothetical protein
MTAVLRAALTLTVLAGIALAGAVGARAAEPSLGATVQSRVYLADSRELLVWNRSTVPASFSFTAPAGFTIEPASIDLEPDGHGVVTIAGDAADGSAIAIVLTSRAPVPAGASPVNLAFQALVFHQRPVDWLAVALLATAALLGLLVLALALRRWRPWDLRLARVER